MKEVHPAIRLLENLKRVSLQYRDGRAKQYGGAVAVGADGREIDDDQRHRTLVIDDVGSADDVELIDRSDTIRE